MSDESPPHDSNGVDKEQDSAKQCSNDYQNEEGGNQNETRVENDHNNKHSRSRSKSKHRSRSRGRSEQRKSQRSGSRNRKRSGRSRSKSRSKSKSRSRDRKSRSRTPVDGARLHVAELDYDTRKSELERIFSKYGTLHEIWMARNPPCFAFVVYKHQDSADKAQSECDGMRVGSKTVKVTHARPRAASRGMGRGRGFGDLRCYQCGELGHFSRNCTDTKFGYKRPPTPPGYYRRSSSGSRSRSRSRSRHRHHSRRSRSQGRKTTSSRSQRQHQHRRSSDRDHKSSRRSRSRR